MIKILRRLVAIVFLIVFTAAPAFAWNKIYVQKIIDAVTVSASGSTTSDAITLSGLGNLGYFSIQVQVTGDGTAKVEYLLSNDGTTFLEPTGASDIAAGFTKTSGPGSDGKDMYTFNPMLSRYIKIRVTETGGADSVTASVWIVVQ